jgi:glutaredoxin
MRHGASRLALRPCRFTGDARIPALAQALLAEWGFAMNCPKCGYARKLKETAPEGQCPSCGIYYAKFNSAPRPAPAARAAERSDAGGSLKVIIGVLVVVGLLSIIPAPAWLRSTTGADEISGDAPRRKVSEMDFSKAQIVMYSLTTCGYCVSLRRTFEANNIPFTEYFLDADQASMEELTRKLNAAGFRGGGIGTPTLEVNGKMMPNNPPFEEILKQARS